MTEVHPRTQAPQLRGSSLSDWTDCPPPVPPHEWDAVAHELAVRLAMTGGRALG